MNNLIESDKMDNESNSDTQCFISSEEEIKPGVYHKFIDNKFLVCNPNENGWSDSSQQSCSTRKREKKRSTKKELYQNERKFIINKINNLLDVNENKNYVYLYDIENNDKIKEEINKISEEVKKYFKVGNWNYYMIKNKGEKPLEIGLIRAVYRDEGWLMTTKEKQIERNGKKVRSIIYYLIKE